MTQAQFNEFAHNVMIFSLVVAGLSLLRYPKFGPKSLFLTAGFLLMACYLYAKVEGWPPLAQIVLAVALLGCLIGDALSRFGKGKAVK